MVDLEGERDAAEDAEDAAERDKIAKERRFDAKRKRILFLENLLRELDTLVFLELITIYHLEYVGLPSNATTGSVLTSAAAAPSSGSSSAPSSMSAS